eukprot:TRINITY_DN1222_c0_g1_i1.p1 TRINITY_DN1222_c0_g1~~TRINITY_DN1222_c0_g1_i1.p1  ORF type:complete len:2051 (-),score=956.61 TRINITY_DN1222_c0_g1_i1:88-6240(-)
MSRWAPQWKAQNQQATMLKPVPAPSQKAAPGGGPSGIVKAALKVHSQQPKKDVVVTTLCGDYAEQGENHGKKYYKKIQKIAGHENVSVFLYYWDNRDGADFSGWWFGDQLGGAQVWARASVHTPTPPKAGWRIPWDSKTIQPGALVVEPHALASPASVPGKGAGKDGKAGKDDTGKGGKDGKAAGKGPTMLTGNQAAKGADKGWGAATAGKGATTPQTILSGKGGKDTGKATAAAGKATAAAGKAAAAGKGKEDQSSAKGAGKAATPGLAPEARLKKATALVTGLETQANAALTNAKKWTESSPAATLKATVEALEKLQAKFIEHNKAITQEIAECRKAGPSATPTITEISKLSPKVKTLQTQVSTELVKLKGWMNKAETEKKKKEEAAANAKKEETDSKAFMLVLPKMTTLVNNVSSAVEQLTAMASPLVVDPPEGADLTKALIGVEASAADVQKKVTDARNQVNVKMNDAKKYAPEAKKNAMTEFGKLNAELTEAQKLVSSYAKYKKDFPARVQARKAVTEIADKFGIAELEIEKASGMAMAADDGSQLSEEEVKEIETIVQPAAKALQVAQSALLARMKTADAAVKEECTLLQKTGNELKKKLEEINGKIASQKQGLTAQTMLSAARDKASNAEKALHKCQEAEMPFLKGIEVLPEEESKVAIRESEQAAQEATATINQTKAYFRQKANESKKYNKELVRSIEEQLKPLQARVDAAEKKLASFKEETAERKSAALLSGVIDVVQTAERKAEALEKAGKFLEAASDAAVEKIKDNLEKGRAAEKEALAACAEAKKQIAMKQKDFPKTGDAATPLKKLQDRQAKAQETCTKYKSVLASGDKIIRIKEMLTREEPKLKEAEAELAKVEKASKAAKLTDEAIKGMDEGMVNAAKVLKHIQTQIQPLMVGAPEKSKKALEKLAERRKTGSDLIDKIKAATKDMREKVLGEVYAKEAERLVEECEASVEKMNDAELPFLKGLEVIPLQEAKDTVEASEKALAEGQKLVTEVRNYIAQKNIEVRSFEASVTKAAQEAMSKCTERANAAAQKMGTFKKDTDARKKSTRVQEAETLIEEAEALATKVTEAAAPFSGEDADKMTEEDAQAPLETYFAAEKEAKEKVQRLKTIVSSSLGACKDNATQMETLKAVQARTTKVSEQLSKAKKGTTKHEERFISKRLLTEAKEAVDGLEEEVKKATEACAPFVEEGCKRFLVGTSLKTLANALLQHMEDKDKSAEAIFKAIEGGRPVPEKTFLKYLAGLPEKLGKEELAFAEERLNEIFAAMDADKDGSVNQSEFLNIFAESSKCVKEISVTDGFSVADSKTIGKVVAGDLVEVIGAPKKDDAGMLRVKCRIEGGDKEGWITTKGNTGTEFLKAIAPMQKASQELDAELATRVKNINKVSSALAAKLKEGGNPAPGGPLSKARGEMGKMKSQVNTALSSIETLKKKLGAAKKDFAAKEKAELNAHILAKEKKEAEKLSSKAAPAVVAVEQIAEAVKSAGEPLTSLEDDKVATFATPAAVISATEKAVTALHAKVAAARESVKAQLGEVGKITPQTGATAEAKKQLQAMLAKVETENRACKKVLDSCKLKVKKILTALLSPVADALRAEAQSQKKSSEEFFEDISGKKDAIAEASFVKKVCALKEPTVQAEHAKLLFEQIGAGGLTRRRFLSFVQLYYAVVKDIAITDNSELAACKSIRKLEKEELVEVLEGPLTDEKSGLQRIKGKAILDGTEGWVTLQGNQGTPFLTKSKKPFYYCKADAALQPGADAKGTSRTLKEEELLELLEGPKMEQLPDMLKAKVKTSSDGATGWVVLRGKCGTVFADANKNLYLCTSSVAMTDAQNINDCKVIRKLAAGELFEITGEPVYDDKAKVWRVEGTALKDGKLGWITTRGNAGTVFAEAATKYYKVVRECPLQKKPNSATETDTVRKLKEDETFELLERPKEEKQAPQVRIKVRAVKDNAVGWVLGAGQSVVQWSPMYRCILATQLQNQCGCDGAEAICDIAKNEKVEHVDGPVEDGSVVRLRIKLEKDGSVGWVTLKAADGKKYFTH